MIWRRLADVLGLRHAGRLEDERSTHREQLDELERRHRAITVAVKDMTSQSRLGSYRRVRLER